MSRAREVTIRRARPTEAAALSALMLRSKAHWGYDAAFLAACGPLLTITPEIVAREHVYCAEAADGTLAGICHVTPRSASEAELESLFVEPAFIGSGLGKRLWRQAVQIAAALRARTLVFDADPHARPFYEHLGAIVVGEHHSTTFPGRVLPRMCYALDALVPHSSK
ncbi:MAG TPA: GNAT family N-acetyltransferase [Ktedonobacterales bacterium]